MASAQGFNINQLYGKNYDQVTGILGKSIQATKSSVNPNIVYARYNTPGAADTIVWFSYKTGVVGKIQVVSQVKSGETKDDVLKRYHLSLGSDPKQFQLKPPAYAYHNGSPVAGSPWSNIFISNLYCMPFMQGTMQYCKAHGLNPYKTFFWTVQVTARGAGHGNEMSAGSGEGGSDAAKPKSGGRRRKK